VVDRREPPTFRLSDLRYGPIDGALAVGRSSCSQLPGRCTSAPAASARAGGLYVMLLLRHFRLARSWSLSLGAGAPRQPGARTLGRIVQGRYSRLLCRDGAVFHPRVGCLDGADDAAFDQVARPWRVAFGLLDRIDRGFRHRHFGFCYGVLPIVYALVWHAPTHGFNGGCPKAAHSNDDIGLS
jgi:hypothetical protein